MDGGAVPGRPGGRAGAGLLVRLAVRPVEEHDGAHPGQRLADERHVRRPLRDDHGRLRVPQDRLEDVVRSVRGARDVHGAEEVDGEAADHPLGPVVGDQSHELAVADAELARERQRQHARAPVELAVGDGGEDPVFAAAQRGLVGVPRDPVREEAGQCRPRSALVR